MPHFEFRYQTLLKHRQTLEDQRQRELATQVRTRMILTDQLTQMQQTITRSKHDLGAALVGTVDLSRVGEFTRYNAQSTLRGRQIVRKLAEVDRMVDTARRALLLATQQRKALEVLRERDHAIWRQAEALKETAELDELASQAYARQLLEDQRLKVAAHTREVAA